MFGWFSAKCPVTTAEKAWTEKRMCWLAEQFGIKRLLDAQVATPDGPFLPAPYAASPEYARRLMQRVGDWLGVRTDDFTINVSTGESGSTAADEGKLEAPALILLSSWQLENPERLTATLAHKISQRILSERDLVAFSVTERERVAELLPVFFGLGIFTANSTAIENDHGPSDLDEFLPRYRGMSRGSGPSGDRQFQLPARVFGYALALFAFLRGERRPEWATHLRLDAAEPLRLSLRYLRKTNDTLCHPDTMGQRRQPTPEENLIRDLKRGTASVRLATLWEIRDRHITSTAVVDAVGRRLDDDRDADIPRAACETLASLGAAAEPIVPDILHALRYDNEETRIGAAYALGVIGGAHADQVIPALGFALADHTSDVVSEAAKALQSFGLQAESAVPQLLSAISKALADCKPPMIEVLMQTLMVITPDPVASLRESFEERDPELCDFALLELRKQGVS
jgi:hypothetical protein